MHEREFTMDYSLIQNADKDLIYYGVYNTEAELLDGSDLLCAVRKSFFESGKRQKNRSSFNFYGEIYRSAYTMEENKPLKWKKLIGSKQSEKTVVSDNGYFVETLDLDRKPVKRTYYDNHHIWISTEYFSPTDRRIPTISLKPSTDGNKPVIIRRKSDGQTDILYPFEQVVEKALTDKLNIIDGEPQIFCRTSSGSFYFCTHSESEKRSEALKKLLEKEEDTDIEQNTGEEIIPAFEVNADALNEAPAVLEITEENIAAASDVEEVTEEAEIVQEEDEENISSEPAEETVDEDEVTETEESAISEHEPTELIPETFSPAAVPGETEDSDNVPDLSAESFSDETPEYIPNRPICAFMQDCPYEYINKMIIDSGGKQYYYFGDIADDKRSGNGRTAMSDGKTAYEGSYKDDKRDGFGVYYFKSGKLCYAGSWKQNRREGLGIAFSPSDGSAFIGKWQDNNSIGIGASFDKDGNLVYLGKTEDGKRSGTGITYSPEKDTFFVGKYKDGEFLGTGTQFDSDGNILYVGGYRGGIRTGKGTSYHADGTVCYRGEWKNNRYHGEGILYLSEGGTISGTFRNGRADGKCTLTDSSGRVIYTGSFANDIYNGTGRLFSEDGSYVEGRFVDGEPTGIFNEYDSEKQLVYCGEWNDMHRSGKGIEYKDGEKLYEGEFKNSLYDGDGKLYSEGRLIYSGGFVGGNKTAYGVEYNGSDIRYIGMWKDGLYSGCGILYDDGLPRYTGCFENGRREGRINEISEKSIIRKCVYKNDELIYMCEYSPNGLLLYYGNVKDGLRNGMGSLFNENCEKEFEGIFKNGEPEKTMQVFYKVLDELPSCEELAETEYEYYRQAPQYAVEKAVSGGVYTGQLKSGKPDGKGTVMYSDHRYTGMFIDGLPCGEGVIYMTDGSKISGVFNTSDSYNGEALTFADITYYRTAK